MQCLEMVTVQLSTNLTAMDVKPISDHVANLQILIAVDFQLVE